MTKVKITMKNIYPFFSFHDGRVYWREPKFPAGADAKQVTWTLTAETIGAAGKLHKVATTYSTLCDAEYHEPQIDAWIAEWMQKETFRAEGSNLIIDVDCDRPQLVFTDINGDKHTFMLGGYSYEQLHDEKFLDKFITKNARQIIRKVTGQPNLYKGDPIATVTRTA